MAAWTVLSWEKAIYMIEQGTQACNINENPLYISCPGAPAPKALSSGLTSSTALKSVPPSTAYRNKKLAQLGLGVNDIVVTRTERGTYLSPSESLKNRLIEAENKRQSKQQPPAEIHSEAHLRDDDDGFNLNATYSTDIDYSRLGWDITSGDFNADGYADVVMSAPGNKEKLYLMITNYCSLTLSQKAMTVPWAESSFSMEAKESSFSLKLSVTPPIISKDSRHTVALVPPLEFSIGTAIRSTISLFQLLRLEPPHSTTWVRYSCIVRRRTISFYFC